MNQKKAPRIPRALSVNITDEVEDRLVLEAKARAALERKTLHELVFEGLMLRLAQNKDRLET